MKYFDLHSDTLFAIARDGGCLRRRSGHMDLERLRHYSNCAQVFALFCGPAPLEDPNAAHQMAQRLFCTAQEQFADCTDGLQLCRTALDFDRAQEQHKIAAFLSVEGAELLQCEEDMQTAVDMGVRMITLSWNHDSVFACGAASDPNKGLTKRGRELVHRMETHGIFPDVSHLSERGFWELAEQTDMPILATHSNSRAICDHVRNLTDAQVREIIRRGGLIGLNFYVPFLTKRETASVSDVYAHIDHMMELGGASCLALGADFDGCDRLPNRVNDVTDMEIVAEELLRHGYAEAWIQDLFFENAARFVHTAF